MRGLFWFCFVVYLLCVGLSASTQLWWALGFLAFLAPIFALGVRDALQNKHAILKNFPVLGHARYLFELIRPEIHQYFVESNHDGVPFSREQRSVVYQRAKKTLDTLPFGTQLPVYRAGYEWLNHSIAPVHLEPDTHFRVEIGGKQSSKPYQASLLNIGAMSFGSLSKPAIEALNIGAKIAGFAHNTGEGGISPYHKKGGDLIYQLGTGYFGARAEDGGFDLKKFEKTVDGTQTKMIEIKLSQGAKPGHGGILPAGKVTAEIADIRGVPMGKDVLSPPYHKAFKDPAGLLNFIASVREAAGGVPTGFKICIGQRSQFLSICKQMRSSGIYPDFITVDGGEGGTGAAPLEFSNRIGSPLVEGLCFVDNALKGFNLRKDIKIIASSRILTGFDVIKALALGADLVYSARGMMLALGCIQALKCNSNHCPTGVASQDPKLYGGLVASDKAARVANYHKETMHSVVEMLGAMGIQDPDDLRPHHIRKRISEHETRTYAELYPGLNAGDLLTESIPQEFVTSMQLSGDGSRF